MKLTRFHCLKIFEWCKKTYGRSKYNRGILTMEFTKPTEITGYVLGYYDNLENMIHINSQDHYNVHDLALTIIEEYQHYLKSDAEYQKLIEIHGYEDHPHEIESKQIAERDAEKCISYLKRLHHQFNES
jgi:hypothetical protein